jgi:mono/diheme cytochrome c family protein
MRGTWDGGWCSAVACAALSLLLLSPAVPAGGQERRPLTEADAQGGRPLYLRECAACHGERGDGAGPAAEFLDPRPRDFTKKIFKIRTSDPGMPPRTDDVLATIERGFPGTAMPSFAFLSEPERRQLAAEVLSLAGLLKGAEPPKLPAPATPPATTPKSIARGKELYRNVECYTCHGKTGKGDGPAAATLKDVDGRPIPPRNLTTGMFRGGGDRLDLYYRLSTGMDGSPMPEFASSIEEADRWALIDYVLTLAKSTAPKRTSGNRAALEIAQRTGCRGCHVLGDGHGGTVGPDLRLSAQKLRPEWLEHFLAHPREGAQIYPASAYRMPNVTLTEDEVRILSGYFASLSKRPRGSRRAGPGDADSGTIEQGKAVFASRCSACHSLAGTPAGSGNPPGPDLTPAATRLDFDWLKDWLGSHAEKVGGSPLGQPDAEAVRAFVWKASSNSSTSSPPGG